MSGWSTQAPSRFWRKYLVFVLILVLFWVWMVWYVSGCMRAYEAAQPERVLEELSRQLSSRETAPEMDFQPPSRFEDEESCAGAFFSRLEGKELTWGKAAGSYDAKAPVYTLYAGGEAVASALLREVSSRPLMLILTVSKWEVAEVAPVLEGSGAPLRIMAPDSFTVYINGVEADGRERTGESRAIEEFRYAAEYTAVPELVEYRIEGLLLPPEVEITDDLGRRVPFETDGEGRIVAQDWLPSEDMDGQLREYVLTNAKNYSNFFSSDLPGSTVSTAPIQGMFPEGSDYLTLAENYRRHDMWMYSPHYTPVFSEERVSNYIRYSEDFFSCEVSFDKKMILIRTGEERHDLHDTRYYYVRIDGDWLITDMRSVLEE